MNLKTKSKGNNDTVLNPEGDLSHFFSHGDEKTVETIIIK